MMFLRSIQYYFLEPKYNRNNKSLPESYNEIDSWLWSFMDDNDKIENLVSNSNLDAQ